MGRSVGQTQPVNNAVANTAGPAPAGGMKGGGQPLVANNVNQTSANTYNQAVGATNAAMQFQPGSLAGTDMNTYQNPYTQQVIDTSMADMNRANQMALNNVGAQARSANAFGGSRQGVAEALTNEAFANQAGSMSANLRNQGYNTALGAAQFDIGNQVAQQGNVLNAASQLGNLSQQGFNYGQTLNNNLATSGNQQQNLVQQIINAANQEYGGITGYPQQMLQLPMAALGQSKFPTTTTQTQTKDPGLFDYLTLAATTAGGFK